MNFMAPFVGGRGFGFTPTALLLAWTLACGPATADEAARPKRVKVGASRVVSFEELADVREAAQRAEQSLPPLQPVEAAEEQLEAVLAEEPSDVSTPVELTADAAERIQLPKSFNAPAPTLAPVKVSETQPAQPEPVPYGPMSMETEPGAPVAKPTPTKAAPRLLVAKPHAEKQPEPPAAFGTISDSGDTLAPVAPRMAHVDTFSAEEAAAQMRLVRVTTDKWLPRQTVRDELDRIRPNMSAAVGQHFVQVDGLDPTAPPSEPLPPGMLPGGGPAIPVGPPTRAPLDAEPIENVPPPGFEIIEESPEILTVQLRRSVLLRAGKDIYRTQVVDPQIADIIQFTPREISIIGKSEGTTSVTFWFRNGDGRPVSYLVKVKPDAAERERVQQQYTMLEEVLAELFPDSKVELIAVADKLIVRGQAKDSEEAAQILAIVRGQVNQANIGAFNAFGSIAQGTAAQVLSADETGRAPSNRITVVNMLRVPGVQQVALRVKIAELNRTAARGFGIDVNAAIGDITTTAGGTVDGAGLFLNSMLNAAAGNAPAVLTNFDSNDIQLGLRYLSSSGVVKVLSEPTLVTMSGRPANFVAGGEFAVPTTVGVGGASAVTTDFRAFGVLISFLPTVLDKDRIRLQVSPEFSQIDANNSVNNIPGLNVRAVTTTVEMREGQTLAIAGLLDDSLVANKQGDLPILSYIFGRRDVTRNETELIILVTPELVHPMEPEAVPPLPGYDVTEPTCAEFYLRGHLEGDPTLQYRSTIWPRLRHRYQAGAPAMISGPFGHGQ